MEDLVQLDMPRLWSTYSARRALPTAMMDLDFDPRKADAAGNWAAAESTMNVRYSASQVAAATLARAEGVLALVQAKRIVGVGLVGRLCLWPSSA